MKLIIDIDEEDYKNGTLVKYFNCYSKQLDEIIYNGTLLPKGHGRLIDAERYRNEMLASREFDFFKTLDMQPTIVEADKGE